MNYNIKRERCTCCVMPKSKAGKEIDFDENGICSICQRFKQENVKEEGKAVESFDDLSAEQKLKLFRKKAAKYKSENSVYDCAVAVSGGKDSIMTLYIAKKILGFQPLAIFVDNGFALDQMYENVKNATDILGCDLIIYKTSDLIEFFRLLLSSKKKIYYCRVCHALLDLKINEICQQNNIRLVLGGYTKGQQYIRNTELFSIYDISDANTISLIENHEKFGKYKDLYKNQNSYFRKHFPEIVHMSPFKYIDWNEDEILQKISTELKFKLPERSWPNKSSNCTFNYVAQLLAMEQFGFAQHETELSDLIRKGEMTRERAINIIETPIEDTDLKGPLEKIGLSLEEVLGK